MESQVKKNVKKYYGSIASKVDAGKTTGCCSGSGSGSGCSSGISKASIIYKGEKLEGLPKEALEASLGCANPVVFAKLKEGETVLDLGSGGGINVLMAAKYVGSDGHVYGLDMTDEMLRLANRNKDSMGAVNVDFLKGYIEDIPLKDELVDVILSNCVINLSDDKEKAASEAYRVLKKGGRLAIADIITLKEVPPEIRAKADLWCSCIAGTITIGEYTRILANAGFKNIEITPEHIYTKEIIEQTFLKGNSLDSVMDDVTIELLDGAFAGAYIKAEK